MPRATGNEHLINNRQQQGGRRRGRGGQGGQRPQGMQGNSSGGNARDNRQRGNAAQLLEKYKSMARDSQLAGDRVQTEYYLQFADHYFRVLEDGRSRFEDQQQQQGRRRPQGDDDFDGDDEEGMISDGADDGDDGDDGDDDGDNRPQRQEPQRQDRQEQPRQQQQQRPRRDRPERTERPERPRREAANEGVRGDADGNVDSRDERIPLGVLPPAIGAAGDEDGGEVEAPRPRRRARRVVSDDDGDIAPAA